MTIFKYFHIAIVMLWVSVSINSYYQNKKVNLMAENINLIKENMALQIELNNAQAKFNEMVLTRLKAQ